MGAKIFGLCLATSIVTGCGGMRQGPTDDPKIAERQILALLTHWADAFRRKDLNEVMAIYSPGDQIIAYDLVPPLEYRGADAYRRDYAAFFAQFSGPMEVEIRDLHVNSSGDIAFSFGLEKIGGTLANGPHVETWVRFTEGYRRIDGRWFAVHDHISVPVETETGKARLDLKP